MAILDNYGQFWTILNNYYMRMQQRDRDVPVVKKNCYFCTNKITTVDYKDGQTLRRFMSPHAKIMNRKKTGSCPKHQRMITLALKRARHMAFLPFVAA